MVVYFAILNFWSALRSEKALQINYDHALMTIPFICRFFLSVGRTKYLFRWV